MYWNYPYGMVSHAGAVTQQRQERDRDRIFSEDFLQRNIGKRVTVYMTFDASSQWRDKVFTGVLRRVGRDFFVIRDQKTGRDIMLLNINLDYIVFEEQTSGMSDETN
ncbi:spore coat protein GerQ [Paenactinomyces guangxiensis]|uniref:Spore coat protein GerQ n=1 Tax=Paenactinomyces guangxiensis TaxID=1490290 RepID=A0A7W1WMZ7_9BACL|nr:spore coat protein GerQ [Paenactinomyces guangxiensis]MBA4492776.1 spore coat protein GerQ [Paenactinomyces guangxiensis]MBH8590375.1 spore coat protein GerQ [Paenactinomyces guangxiensis]